MSQITRQEVLERKRWRYCRAGRKHKQKVIDEVVELFGYHRKATIRALRWPVERKAPFVIGRPREYEPERLLKPLKAIWLHALQPCGVRLKAAVPEWLPAYEQDHERLDAEVRESLLAASRATLDRLLKRARVPFGRSGRKTLQGIWRWIPWHCAAGAWMMDGVDIHTTRNEMRALPNRSEAATVLQIGDVEHSLPFPLCGLDSEPTKERLRTQKQKLNPFALRRQIDQQLKLINQQRLLPHT